MRKWFEVSMVDRCTPCMEDYDRRPAFWVVQPPDVRYTCDIGQRSARLNWKPKNPKEGAAALQVTSVRRRVSMIAEQPDTIELRTGIAEVPTNKVYARRKVTSLRGVAFHRLTLQNTRQSHLIQECTINVGFSSLAPSHTKEARQKLVLSANLSTLECSRTRAGDRDTVLSD